MFHRPVGVSLSCFRKEWPALLRLAAPVVAAELGWMGMGIADTVMVGKISAEAIGAVAIGNVIFNTIGILVIGFLLGMDTLISQAVGRQDLADAAHTFRQGLWLGAIVAPVLLGIMLLLGVPGIAWWGVDTGVAALAQPYTAVLAWSVLPVMVYTAARRYLQSTNAVRPVMIALLSANVVNILGNWVLIEGHWGMPALGVTGCAYSTILSRIYMAVFLSRSLPAGLWRWVRPERARIGELFRLGLPAAGHIFLEISGFAAATALVGWFPPVALAAHEIALNNAALTYMVPLGISSAAAVRVGQAVGRGEIHAARVAGWTAIAAGATFMLLSAVTLWAAPVLILRIYTPEVAVISFGIPLLYAAAAFQIFDGIQVVTTGALRGIGDTRTPFYANIVGYWVLSIPVGALLCFRLGFGVLGLWFGFCLGLFTVAVWLLLCWWRADIYGDSRESAVSYAAAVAGKENP